MSATLRLPIVLLCSVAAVAATHPLDPLSADEIAATVGTLRAAHKATNSSRYPLLVLREPPKSEVLAFAAGKPIRREASVMLYERGAQKTFEGVVDLTERKLTSWKEMKGVMAPLMIEDMSLTDELVTADSEWKRAMAKRGITDLSKVEVDGWSAGYHGLPEDQLGHRLVRAVAYYRGDAKTAYTRPVEGLAAFVDLTAKKVQVVDTGVVPLPPEDDHFKSVANGLPPLEISQPQGSGIIQKGQEVNWANWQFRFAIHPREGLVLYNVAVRDHGKLRPILYRGSLSDMLVPYGDPSPTWYFRNVFDTGEYAFVGRSLVPLNRGVDVPGNATFYDSVFADEFGRAYKTQRSAAVYVRDGGLLWRYSDLTSGGRAESRRAQELVLAWIVTAGNYEYGFNWVFHEDGRLEMEVLLTGIMMAKAIVPGATHDMMHGHRVTENLEAIHHQHFFNFRLDMDVDGAGGNRVVETNTTAAVMGPADPYGKAMLMKETPLRRESEAQRVVDASASRRWKVINPGSRNALGEPVGYLLIPGENSAPYMAPNSWIRKRAGFVNAHLWVTPYEPSEMNAAGTYINQSEGGRGLPLWTSHNRSIENTDVVLWYTMAVTHIPRPEEWPVMPVHKAGFQLVPSGFFSRNPTME